jgi:hypothetical protein
LEPGDALGGIGFGSLERGVVHLTG